MTTRVEFAQKLKARGATADQVRQGFELYRQKNGAFDDEQDAPAAKAPAAPAPVAEEPPRIPAGTSGAETVARGMLPRSFKAAEEDAGVVRQATAGALDALSAPGRLVASLNAKDGGTVMMPLGMGGAMIPVQKDAVKGRATPERELYEGMADTEGKTLAGKIVRDPALLPSLATGGLAAGAAGRLGLTGLKGASAAGALLGAESGAIHQADNAAQGRDVSLGSAALETAAGAALPVAGSLASKGVAAAGRGIKNTGGRVVESVIKPLDAAIAKGFDIENFFKHKLYGSSLRASKWMEQAGEKVDAFRKTEGAKVGAALKESGAEFDGKDLLDRVQAEVEADVKAGRLDPAGAANALKIYRGRIAAITDKKTGMVPAEAYNNLKRRGQADAEALYKAKNLGTDIHATEKQVFAQKLAGNARQDLEGAVPDVIEPNKNLAETAPFKRSVQKAEDRLAKRDLVSLKGAILGAAAGYAADGKEGAAAGLGLGGAAPVAIMLGNKLLTNPAVGTGLYRLGSGLERLGTAGDRLIRLPFNPKAAPVAKELDAETLANLEALRTPQDLNPPGAPAGRKVINIPNQRRPLGEQPLPPLRGRLPTDSPLPPRESSLSYGRRPLSRLQPDDIPVDALGDIQAAQAERDLAPLSPRMGRLSILPNPINPLREPPKVAEFLNNAGRRPIEFTPEEMRIKQGLAAKQKLESRATMSAEGAENAAWRREKATKYLTETTGKEPTQKEVYEFLGELGDNPVPTPPKVEAERAAREFNGRRDKRSLEFLDRVLRAGNPEINTVEMKAAEAPQTFSLQGMTLKRVKGKWDNMVTFKDQTGRTYEFKPSDPIHRDLGAEEVPF